MLICTKCKKEMQCQKVGVTVRYMLSHSYAGDRYKCNGCGIEMILTTNSPYQSTAPLTEHDVQMP